MADERSTLITIGGNEYEMLLTTKAPKEIANRYAGLSTEQEGAALAMPRLPAD